MPISRRAFLGAVPAVARRAGRLLEDRSPRSRRPPQPHAPRHRPALAAFRRQRRIRLHRRPHRPADLPAALRQSDAALHAIAVGLAHRAQSHGQRPVRSTPHGVRHLRPQGRLPDQFHRPDRSLQLAPRESAPPASGPHRLRHREAGRRALHPADARPVDRHPAQRIRMARAEDRGRDLLPSHAGPDRRPRARPHPGDLRISVRVGRDERGGLDAPGKAQHARPHHRRTRRDRSRASTATLTPSRSAGRALRPN